ncbi:RNA polymerase sigma factor [Planctomycetota bacterium]
MVRNAISSLPRLYRELLILRYYNGMNYEQIGTFLGLQATLPWTHNGEGDKNHNMKLLLCCKVFGTAQQQHPCSMASRTS